MKKSILAISALVALAFSSCKDKYPEAVLTTPSIAISAKTLTLEEGKSETVKVEITETLNGKPVSTNSNKALDWTSSDEAVATVSGGTITAVKAGTATITATAKFFEKLSTSCTVTVTPAPLPEPADTTKVAE